MSILADFWTGIQGLLFTAETLWQCSLTETQKQLVSTLEVVRIEEHLCLCDQRLGRRPHDRRRMARALVAKAVYNFATTKQLREALMEQEGLRQICGWSCPGQIPSESTFSRAFATFADRDLGSLVHEHLVRQWVGDQLVMHQSRDSTELPAREKTVRKRAKKRISTFEATLSDGRVVKGTRLEIQKEQTIEEILRDLPQGCDAVTKRDSNGNLHTLIGYKVHVDWADGMIPLTVILTSASVHDSQAAIPLARMSAKRVTACYELMDQAYDAASIRQVCGDLNHILLIDPVKNRKKYCPFDPAQKMRYRHRSNAERGNSRLKDEFGFQHLRVRGHKKVLLHAMMGILALFADQIVKPLIG